MTTKGGKLSPTENSLEALATAYKLVESKSTKVQILSVIDLYPYNKIKNILPETTDYIISQAKKHLLTHGRGQPAPTITKY